MTFQQAYRELSYQLSEIYASREAANIAALVTEHLSGKKKIDWILDKQAQLTDGQARFLAAYTEKLLQHTPVQYVLHEAWFAGMKLYVDENVLIPRPETEELVDWIISNISLADRDQAFKIIDVGTGSGCIAIALKKNLPVADVHAFDISEAALHVAQKNALLNNTKIHFFKADIFCENDLKNIPLAHLIVSNPPYVMRSEGGEMRPNVSLHEPHLALFVADESPLLFYEHICNFSLSHLQPGGHLYFEINERLASGVATLLRSKGFTSIEIKKDLQHKDRCVKAVFLPSGN